MSAGEALNAKARDYEVLAASEVERAPLGQYEEHIAAATAFAAVAIALREVALSAGRGRVSGRKRPRAALGRRVVGGVSVEAAVGGG